MSDAGEFCPNRVTKYPAIGEVSPGCETCQAFCCASNSAPGCHPALCSTLSSLGLAINLLGTVWAFAKIRGIIKQKGSFCEAPLPLFYLGLVAFVGRAGYYVGLLFVPNFATMENVVMHDLWMNMPTSASSLVLTWLLWIWTGVLARIEGMEASRGTRFFTFYRKTIPVMSFNYFAGYLGRSLNLDLTVGQVVLFFVAPSIYIGFPWSVFGVWKLSREVKSVFDNVNSSTSTWKSLVTRLTSLTRKVFGGWLAVTLIATITIIFFSTRGMFPSTPCEVTFFLLRVSETFLVFTVLGTMSRSSISITVVEPVASSVRKVITAVRRASHVGSSPRQSFRKQSVVEDEPNSVRASPRLNPSVLPPLPAMKEVTNRSSQ